MSEWILDASALLAYLYRENGADRVEAALRADIAMSAVNLSEVIAKLLDAGWIEPTILQSIRLADVAVVEFDEAAAYEAGSLRALTCHRSLSLGDRACLALARRVGAPVLTADRAWGDLQLGVPVEVIR